MQQSPSFQRIGYDNHRKIRNRDSIKTKVLGEEGVGLGEEKPFSRRVLLPLPNLHFTPYRSVQLTQGSMLLTMTGMSASWQSFIMTVRASQFM